MATSDAFRALSSEVSALMRERRFAEAYTLITAEAPRFPDDASDAYYLRSCLAARSGDDDLALALLREALDCGYFYAELVLRQSPSWQSLQELPEFEQLAVRSIQRQREVAVPAHFLAHKPENTPAPFRAVVALHGNGGNATETLAGWRPVLEEQRLLAAIQSSQPVAQDAYVWDDQELARREVAEQFDALTKAHALADRHTVIAGFSMGAETALQLALRGTIPTCGFLLLGAAGPSTADPDSVLPLIARQRKTGVPLRGYILLGELDDDHRLERHQRIAGYLVDGGIACGFEVLPGVGHQYPTDFRPAIQRALAFVDPQD